MTLILVTVNSQQATLVSDRRFTVDGQVSEEGDDDRNKAFCLETDDAGLAVAFAGVARVGNFATERWLLETLSEIGPECRYRARAMCGRLALVATEKWKTPRLCGQALTVIMAGYIYEDDWAPRPYCIVVSNFEEAASAPHPVRESFTASFARGLAGQASCSLALAFGAGRNHVSATSFEGLVELARSEAHAEIIVDKSVAIVRGASEVSDSSVGRRANSLVIQADGSADVLGAYHVEGLTNVIKPPSFVRVRSDQAWAMADIELASETDGVPDDLFARVRRDDRCPCGSGLKFKRCCGR